MKVWNGRFSSFCFPGRLTAQGKCTIVPGKMCWLRCEKQTRMRPPCDTIVEPFHENKVPLRNSGWRETSRNSWLICRQSNKRKQRKMAGKKWKVNSSSVARFQVEMHNNSKRNSPVKYNLSVRLLSPNFNFWLPEYSQNLNFKWRISAFW